MNYYTNIKQEFLKNNQYKKIKDYSKNKNDLETYFNVGKLLFEAQGGENETNYGNQLIKQYSKKLTKELGKGYTYTSLSRMRQFYLIFQNIATLSQQFYTLSWSHYCEIIPIKDESKRNYYINISMKETLSVRELRNRIKSNEYERLDFKNKENIPLYEEQTSVIELIKNPILIKNTTDNNDINEYTLKHLILEDIDNFLSELGTGFTYVGTEYKIKIGDRYNYIDILLYNIKFNCYVVVEIKVTELKAEHIGQIKKYMGYIDKNLKQENQNNTLGILIVKENNQFVIEYVGSNNVLSTTYQLV